MRLPTHATHASAFGLQPSRGGVEAGALTYVCHRTMQLVRPGGRGGGGGYWRQTHWVWPLPPAGPLVFVCEWPATGIPLTRNELDAQAILDAAARAEVIFSDEGLPDWPDDEGGGQALAVPR
jgi:hypothetical protein